MPKKRRCMEPDCEYPPIKGKRRCGFHWLDTQPIEVQERAAASRLARHEGEPRARVPEKEWPPGARWCSGCQSFVPMFYVRGSRCRACASTASHRSKVEKEYIWPPGVTYEGLLAHQGGRCAICRKVPRSRRMAVDHDHKLGWVRGLLCGRCNHELLGAAQESAEILRRAADYLESPPTIALARVE